MRVAFDPDTGRRGMTDAMIYRAAPTPAALKLIQQLTDEHADQVMDAAHMLLLQEVANNDETMGIALEAYCLLQNRAG